MDQPELISKTAAETLETHAKFISSCIRGQRKSAAEQFGYAFLAGHRLLLAKADLPHGNSDSDLNGGLQRWAERRFRDCPYRTLSRWMVFAEAVTPHLVQTPAAPLMLDRSKIKACDRPVILDAVLRVMDGKGMMKFMRDSRLLRDPEKPLHHPRKPVSPDKAIAAKTKKAGRLWSSIRSDLHLAATVLSLLDDQVLAETLDALVTASNQIRALQRARGASARSNSTSSKG